MASFPLVFSARSKHFSLFGRAKIKEGQKNVRSGKGEGEGEGRKGKLFPLPDS